MINLWCIALADELNPNETALYKRNKSKAKHKSPNAINENLRFFSEGLGMSFHHAS